MPAERGFWSGGRERERTQPAVGRRSAGPWQEVLSTVGPAHSMKRADTQSSRSEHGSGIAEGKEQREAD